MFKSEPKGFAPLVSTPKDRSKIPHPTVAADALNTSTSANDPYGVAPGAHLQGPWSTLLGDQDLLCKQSRHVQAQRLIWNLNLRRHRVLQCTRLAPRPLK